MLSRHVGVPLDIPALEEDLAALSGLDRYDTITWRLVTNESQHSASQIRGRPKPYAPPFMMLGVNLENTTSSDFHVSATGRYLAYGLATSASELRVDGTLGSESSDRRRAVHANRIVAAVCRASCRRLERHLQCDRRRGAGRAIRAGRFHELVRRWASTLASGVTSV